MDIAAIDPAVAYPDESLRMIVYRMAQTGLTASRSSIGSDGWSG